MTVLGTFYESTSIVETFARWHHRIVLFRSSRCGLSLKGAKTRHHIAGV